MRRIVVTGNMGYVGPAVIRRLRARYPQAVLVGFDTGYFAHCLTAASRLPECDLDLQRFGDVRNPPADLFDGADGVVFLAAISNDPIGNKYEEVTLDVNYRSTVAMAKQARAAGVSSVVFASSCSIYGAAGPEGCDEQSPVNPLTAYARSKVAAEQGLAELANGEFSVTCLRFATACGMSDRLRLDLVLNDFVAAAVLTGKIEILSDGTPWRPLIHNEDMSRAITWALGRPQKAGGPALVVNVGADDWNYRVRDLAEAVAAEIPGTTISVNSNAAPDKRSYRVKFGRYREIAPEAQPAETLAGTIRDLVTGIRAMPDLDASFRQSRYNRLVTLIAHSNNGALSADLRWQPPASRDRRA